MANFERLKEVVLLHSKATNWNDAKLEWELVDVFNSSNSCICGQSPIIENCIIENQITGCQLTVGNKCVQRFGGQIQEDARDSFKQLKKMERTKQKKMGFGSYCDQTYAYVLENDEAYVEWCQSRTNPCKAMQKFIDFVASTQ